MRETRLESVLELRRGGLPAPVAANLVARAAEALGSRPRVLSIAEIRVRQDGAVRLTLRDGAPPLDYRAPEVVRGEDGDPRAAVFALGVMLVHVALGRSPFHRESDLETRLAVGSEPIPSLAARAAKASPALDAIARKACAKDPEARYVSPAALQEALDAYLEDELHESGLRPLAAAVREAVQRLPSHDRSTLPNFETAELRLQPADRPSWNPSTSKALDEDFVRLGDPLPADLGASSDEWAVGGSYESAPRIPGPERLELDTSVVEAEERSRTARTVAPLPAAPEAPNWLLRVGLALGALLLCSLIYRFVIAPLLP